MPTDFSFLSKGTFASCLLFSGLMAAAQHGELLKQGQWTVQLSGGCSSLPLLQVNGPGTLFDPANAGALSDLQHALAAPLTQACPGVHDAVLVNGRSRRLIKIESASASVPGSVPPLAPVPTPGRVPLPVATATPVAPSSTQASPAQAQTQVPAQPLKNGSSIASNADPSGAPDSPFIDTILFRNQQARHPAATEHHTEPLQAGGLQTKSYTLGPFISIIDRARSQNGAKLMLERLQNGKWVPTTVRFSAQDQSFVANGIPFLGKIIASKPSDFVVTLSENGIITGKETGSTQDLRASGTTLSAGGNMTWTGTETLDLNSGADNWTFEAEMEGHAPNIKLFNGVKGTLTASDSVHQDLAIVPGIDVSRTKGDVNVASDPANARALIIGNLSYRNAKGAPTLRFSDHGVLTVPLINRAGLDLNELRYDVTTADQTTGLLNAATLSGPFQLAHDAQIDLPLAIGTGFGVPSGGVKLVVTISYRNTVLGRRSVSVPTEPFFRNSNVHLPDATSPRLKAVAKYFGNGNALYGDPAPELAAAASRDPLAAMWQAVFYSQGVAGYKFDQEKAYQDARKLLPQLEERARDGDAEAVYLFFYACQLGLEGEVGTTDARQFLDRAASAGFLPAKFDQALLLASGKGNSHAVGPLKDVYDAGVKAAAYVLGRVYEQGLGVERDPQTAYQWYQRGAEFGDPAAILGLAHLTAGGFGENQPDAAKAMQLARQAAARKDSGAYLYIGRKYASGRQGVKQDPTAASKAFKEAADLGDRDGMLELGAMLLGDTPGFTADEPAGAYWVRQAAERGSPQAMVLLTSCYQEGKGLEKDVIAARYWFNQAALRGVVAGNHEALDYEQQAMIDTLHDMSSAPKYVYVNRYGKVVGEDDDLLKNAFAAVAAQAIKYYLQQQELIDGMEFIQKHFGKKIYGGTVSSSFTSKLQLKAGQAVSVRAYGEIETGFVSGRADANGLGLGWADYRFIPNIPTSAVMGKVGDSPWQLVGTRAQITAPKDGPLTLALNGRDYKNYKGYFDLVVEVPDEQ